MNLQNMISVQFVQILSLHCRSTICHSSANETYIQMYCTSYQLNDIPDKVSKGHKYAVAHDMTLKRNLTGWRDITCYILMMTECSCLETK